MEAKTVKGRRASGFTLIELMIVVAIIGILAAIAIPKFANLIRQAQDGSTKGNLSSLRSALSIYYGDLEGVYPSDLDLLTMNGKYLNAVPTATVNPYHGTESGDNTTTTSNPPAWTDGTGVAWLYDSNAMDSNWGYVWVDCTHTDTKGSIWTAY